MFKGMAKDLPINLKIPTPTSIKILMSFANYLRKEDTLLFNAIVPKR